MTPAATIKRRARTGTAPAGRTSKADGSEQLFIVGYRPFPELCARALPGRLARDCQPQRRALQGPLVPARRVLGPVCQMTYGGGGGGATTGCHRPLDVVDRDRADQVRMLACPNSWPQWKRKRDH